MSRLVSSFLITASIGATTAGIIGLVVLASTVPWGMFALFGGLFLVLWAVLYFAEG